MKEFFDDFLNVEQEKIENDVEPFDNVKEMILCQLNIYAANAGKSAILQHWLSDVNVEDYSTLKN